MTPETFKVEAKVLMDINSRLQMLFTSYDFTNELLDTICIKLDYKSLPRNNRLMCGTIST